MAGVAASRILLAGATGLVGGELVRALLADRAWRGRLLAPVRRAIGVADDRCLALVTDFELAGADTQLATEFSSRLSGEPLDAYVCCLGTTLKTAGSREAFIAVDRELVLRLAKVARELGARQAILVSSAGASRQSGNFYLRVKGEVEDALAELGFERVDILQPGLLLGARHERRPGEAIAQALAPVFNPLLLGKLRRYRAVDAGAVARAIAVLLGRREPGLFVHETPAIEALGG